MRSLIVVVVGGGVVVVVVCSSPNFILQLYNNLLLEAHLKFIYGLMLFCS